MGGFGEVIFLKRNSLSSEKCYFKMGYVMWVGGKERIKKEKESSIASLSRNNHYYLLWHAFYFFFFFFPVRIYVSSLKANFSFGSNH